MQLINQLQVFENTVYSIYRENPIHFLRVASQAARVVLMGLLIFLT